MRAAVRTSRELLRLLDLPESDFSDLAETDFPVFVPREFISRMRSGDPHDPLLRQVLASPEEVAEQWSQGGLQDPVGDSAAVRNPGLLQKYAGRALLITSGACAVHCRYCFRRHFAYHSSPKGKSGWQASLETLRGDTSIEEVILSGGDPLTIPDAQLQWLVDELNQMQHVRRIRIHTRFPVVIPQRVCEELLAWIRTSRAAMYFVLHVNHPQEIDAYFADAMNKLRANGATLLNQTVLLRCSSARIVSAAGQFARSTLLPPSLRSSCGRFALRIFPCDRARDCRALAKPLAGLRGTEIRLRGSWSKEQNAPLTASRAH
jgi:EF-P beta-lysylation protein EpmB